MLIYVWENYHLPTREMIIYVWGIIIYHPTHPKHTGLGAFAWIPLNAELLGGPPAWASAGHEVAPLTENHLYLLYMFALKARRRSSAAGGDAQLPGAAARPASSWPAWRVRLADTPLALAPAHSGVSGKMVIYPWENGHLILEKWSFTKSIFLEK